MHLRAGLLPIGQRPAACESQRGGSSDGVFKVRSLSCSCCFLLPRSLCPCLLCALPLLQANLPHNSESLRQGSLFSRNTELSAPQQHRGVERWLTTPRVNPAASTLACRSPPARLPAGRAPVAKETKFQFFLSVVPQQSTASVHSSMALGASSALPRVICCGGHALATMARSTAAWHQYYVISKGPQVPSFLPSLASLGGSFFVPCRGCPRTATS